MFPFILSVFISFSVFAEVGKFLKIEGVKDIHVTRVSKLTIPFVNALIEEGDEIETKNSVAVLFLYPSTQILLNENTKIQITQAIIQESVVGDESTSLIKLIKGSIRLQISKDINQKINQEVNVGDVSFSVRGTDFVINDRAEEVDLKVFEGEVIVSSPHVQTFVPEVVKAHEAFRYGKKKKEFIRRKFESKHKSSLEFLSQKSLHGSWRKLKEARKLKSNVQKK